MRYRLFKVVRFLLKPFVFVGLAYETEFAMMKMNLKKEFDKRNNSEN